MRRSVHLPHRQQNWWRTVSYTHLVGQHQMFAAQYTEITEKKKIIMSGGLGTVSYTHLDVYKRQVLRAIDGVRTRDPDLGKVVLYQLSHYRVLFVFLTWNNTYYTIRSYRSQHFF